VAEIIDIGAVGGYSQVAGQGWCDYAGTTVPVANQPGFAHGCTFRKLDGTTRNDALYVNAGTNLACNFIAVGTTVFDSTTYFEYLFSGVPGFRIDDAAILAYVAPVEHSDGKSIYVNTQNGAETGGKGGDLTITAGDGAASGVAAQGGSIRLAPGGAGPDSTCRGVVMLGKSGSSPPFSVQVDHAEETNTSQSYTAAKLLGSIITSTQTSAVTGTLDTGANMDGYVPISFLGTNVAFEWTLINLGSASGAVTVTASAGHTIVGNAVVAIGTSATFRTRRTAVSTWITYRK